LSGAEDSAGPREGGKPRSASIWFFAVLLVGGIVAAAAGMKGEPLYGYVFLDMPTIGGKKVDPAKDFALCAVPVPDSPASWLTCLVSTDGVVWSRMVGHGCVVKDFPKDPAAHGWQRAE
jgi:hypothetical protein